MAKPKLSIERTLDIPLADMSGICVYRPEGRPSRLVAIGDDASTVVWAESDGDGLGPWHEVDLAVKAQGAMPDSDTQAEALAATRMVDSSSCWRNLHGFLCSLLRPVSGGHRSRRSRFQPDREVMAKGGQLTR